MSQIPRIELKAHSKNFRVSAEVDADMNIIFGNTKQWATDRHHGKGFSRQIPPCSCRQSQLQKDIVRHDRQKPDATARWVGIGFQQIASQALQSEGIERTGVEYNPSQRKIDSNCDSALLDMSHMSIAEMGQEIFPVRSRHVAFAGRASSAGSRSSDRLALKSHAKQPNAVLATQTEALFMSWTCRATDSQPGLSASGSLAWTTRILSLGLSISTLARRSFLTCTQSPNARGPSIFF